MDTKKKNILKFLALTISVGLIASFLIKDYTDRYLILAKPDIAPPMWVFPVAWSIIYILMGIAGGMAYNMALNGSKKNVIILYGLQLIINFLWPVVFFRFGNVMLALYVLLFLWVLVLANMVLYSKINRYSVYLFVPYLLWVSFAAYLNYGIYLLN